MWIITAKQHISPEVTVKGVQKCCITSAVDRTDDDSCGMAVKRKGMLGVKCQEDEDTDCEDGDSDPDW
jgi:hypothetical protein